MSLPQQVYPESAWIDTEAREQYFAWLDDPNTELFPLSDADIEAYAQLMTVPLELSVKDYALAGSSHFTIEGKETRFTYRVRRESTEDENPRHFVHVLTGASNTSDYSYLGTIFDGETYRHGKKSQVRLDATSAKAFAWFWERVNDLPACLTFHKSEKCCRCGRMLTTPDSVKLGIGPECRNKL